MKESRIGMGASRIVAVLAVCLCAALLAFASKAYAADGFASYKDGNGWELAYSVSDAGAITIEDVTAAGSGKLVVPAQIEGHDVVAFASKAFYNDGGNDFTAKMTEIEIPSTVKTFGTYAFMGSGLKSVTIPASVEAIPTSCFAGCTSLAQVNFEGDSIGYFGESAFSGCTALKRIDIPALTETVGNETYRIGRKCFYRCSSLETVVFLGNVNTFDPIGKTYSANVNSSIAAGYYVANIDCFNYCNSLKTVVYYIKKDNIPSGTGSVTFGGSANSATTTTDARPGVIDYDGVATYMTLAFYANAEDSKNCTNPVYTISCRDTVKALDVLKGTVDKSDIWAEWGERPALPEGMTWGIQWNDESNSRVYANTLLENTYNVIPVSEGDLAYGWVSSDAIDTFRDTVSATGSMGTQNYPIFYIDDSKKVFGLDKLVAYLPGGVVADPSTYTIKYQKESTERLDRATITKYTDIAAPDEAGNYRVRAEGTSGASKGTHTSWIVITVSNFSPTVNVQSDALAAARLGRASQAVSNKAVGNAACGVVVPAGNWRNQLIGAGLAGVGNGMLLFDNGTDYSSRAVTAFAQSKASSLQVVGSTSAIPESASPSSEKYLMDFLNERKVQNKTRYSNDATPQQLADQVYTTIRRLQNNGNDVYGEGWGTTAIVVSPKCCIDTLPIAQLAYEEKAPVFFTQADGTLSAADLGYLKNDGFDKIVIAGDTSYVSDACASSIASATGIAPVRMLDAGTNSLEACLDYVNATAPGHDVVAIAATNDPANSTAAALIAAAYGGTMLTCSSTADSKRIQDYLRGIMAEEGQASVATVYLVGDFSNVDAGLKQRISNMWTSPESTAVGTGDSREMGDYVYVVKSGNKAQCSYVRNPDLTNAVVDDFTYQGVKYTAEAPLAGAFARNARLESVTFKAASITTLPAKEFAGTTIKAVDLGSKVKSIGEGAFEGCKSLAKASGSAVTTIGARAFSGCTSLTSAPTGNVTSVGASAFQNCTALGTASLSKVTTLGTSAFAGCVSLSSASLPKATSVSASAFKGCTKLASANAAAAKSLGASAFAGCKALKSFKTAKATSIGESAFDGCSKLTTASFSAKNLNKIGAKAFYGCSKLTSLTLNTKKLKAGNVGANAFKKLSAKVKVYVPKAKVKAYKKLFPKKGLAKTKSVVAAKGAMSLRAA